MAGTVPVDNVIGKARFIAWPPSRWGGVHGGEPADLAVAMSRLRKSEV